MKVRYRLPVTSTLRFEYSFPVKAQTFTYEFEVDEYGAVTHLNATAIVPDKAHWPKIDYTPGEKVAMHVSLNSPYFPFLRYELNAISGMLSVFGLDEIRPDEAEEFSEPQNKEEKDELKLFSFRRSVESIPASSWLETPFDLAARALLVAVHASSFESALNFFRKGRIDVKAEHYLDAVLDFLFMVETTYANGKFRTAHVESEYLASEELKQLIMSSLTERGLRENLRRHNCIEESFKLTYAGKKVEEIVIHLVRLRGELHHHSSRKSGIWHPTDHVRFGADALFLQQLCLGIAFAITKPVLYDVEVARNYESQAQMSARSGSLKVHRK